MYLHTKGKTKEGISVVGHNEDGSPIYSKGMPAVAERNLLRYYFAFAAFFDSAGISDDASRHEKQLTYWYEQTEKFQQLHELDRARIKLRSRLTWNRKTAGADRRVAT